MLRCWQPVKHSACVTGCDLWTLKPPTRQKDAAAGCGTAILRSVALHPHFFSVLQVMALEVVVLGVGAGSTCTYYREASSSFMICLDGKPVLMLDVVGDICAS